MTAARVQPDQRIIGAVADAFSAKVVGQENLRERLQQLLEDAAR
jgi:MoxR-like ATPase